MNESNGVAMVKKPRVERRKPGEFAEDTKVSVEKTRGEIERLVQRAGAKHFGVYVGEDKAGIQFEIGSRRIRMVLPLPDRNAEEFKRYGLGGRSRYNWRHATAEERERKWEQACRARWRALFLVLKAKMEAITVGIATLEDEFLAYTVLPNQQTVGEWIQPQVDEVYRTGDMPPMMPGVSEVKALPGGTS